MTVRGQREVEGLRGTKAKRCDNIRTRTRGIPDGHGVAFALAWVQLRLGALVSVDGVAR